MLSEGGRLEKERNRGIVRPYEKSRKGGDLGRAHRGEARSEGMVGVGGGRGRAKTNPASCAVEGGGESQWLTSGREGQKGQVWAAKKAPAASSVSDREWGSKERSIRLLARENF